MNLLADALLVLDDPAPYIVSDSIYGLNQKIANLGLAVTWLRRLS